MQLTCPNCTAIIPHELINIEKDLAKCVRCDHVFTISHVLDYQSSVEIRDLPQGSKISFEKGLNNSFKVHLPKRKLMFRDVMMFIFGGAFFFMSIVFVGISFNDGFPGLFVLPHMLIGLYIMFSAVQNLLETQTLEIDRYGMKIVKNRLVRIKEIKINLGDIDNVRMKLVKPELFEFRKFFKLMGRMQLTTQAAEWPTIITGKKSVNFFEEGSDSEQEWVVDFLKAVLERRKRSTVESTIV